MSLIGAAARDAWDRWRRDREVVLAIAGMFIFLPLFAWLLLVPEPIVPPGITQDQRTRLLATWAGEHVHWLALRVGFELFATAAIMSFFLTRDRTNVRDVLRHALGLLPMFAVGVMSSWGLVTLGLFAVIVPGLYIYGRVALTGPVLVAERGVGAIGAIARSATLTRGNGWRVLAVLAVPLLGGLVALQLIGSLDKAMGAAGAANPVARTLVDGVAALVATASGIARVMLQISLYAALAAPRHRV